MVHSGSFRRWDQQAPHPIYMEAPHGYKSSLKDRNLIRHAMYFEAIQKSVTGH